MSNDQPVTTDVGTEVLFENARVRMWKMVLAPGESSAMHRHLHDHVFVYANDSLMEGRYADSDEVVSQPSAEGFVYYREVGPDGLPPHQLTNVGTEPSTHYILELLGESASDAPTEPEHNARWVAGSTGG